MAAYDSVNRNVINVIKNDLKTLKCRKLRLSRRRSKSELIGLKIRYSKMETKNKLVDPHSDVKKPNYMLMSLQRILVLSVIMASVVVVVYFTPMPGMNPLY